MRLLPRLGAAPGRLYRRLGPGGTALLATLIASVTIGALIEGPVGVLLGVAFWMIGVLLVLLVFSISHGGGSEP